MTGKSALVALCALLALAPCALAAGAGDATERFTRGLDAYFSGEPYRAIVLVREAMHRPGGEGLREAGLYVLGMSFARIHLYEKSEDALNSLLARFPQSRFAPVAMRELARIFFQLREFGAVVNLEATRRERIPDGRLLPEFWYLLGQSRYMLGEYGEARTPLVRVPPGSPFYPFARYTLAQVEFSQDAPEAALRTLPSVIGAGNAPPLLRDKARRMQGMILYQEKRFQESLSAYRGIPPSSPIFGVSRVDIALAAEAAGNAEAARDAFQEAMTEAGDDLIRTESKVAIGRFLNRQRRSAAARTLFEEAVRELKERSRKLRQNIDDPTLASRTFEELVAFGRQGSASTRAQRLNEDYELLRGNLMGNFGIRYERPPPEPAEKLTPSTYLFPLLQRHFHDPATIETFVGLTIEIGDLEEQFGLLEADLRRQAGAWSDAEKPPRDLTPPPEAEAAIQQCVWLLFAHFDLVSRFYDSLAVDERVDAKTSLQAKRQALATITDGLRLVLFGNRALPGPESVRGMMEIARRKIESGEIPGMRAQKVRKGFLDEWRMDRDSIGYVLENLDLKQRQMMSALSGVPLRSRNLNLPVLSTMTEWLVALRRLTDKYRYIELEPKDRPWYLAGRNAEIVSMLSSTARGLGTLRNHSRIVIRDVARELVTKEELRHSLVTAQAEEGIADALYEERSGR